MLEMKDASETGETMQVASLFPVKRVRITMQFFTECICCDLNYDQVDELRGQLGEWMEMMDRMARENKLYTGRILD